MDDNRIIDLYFLRDERAIERTEEKYGKLLNHIAYNILHDAEDSEECVNDTYMRAWQAMPPQRPSYLSAFLAKITRNLSINRYLQNKSRRSIFSSDTILEEMSECIPDTSTSLSENVAIRDALNSFLSSLDETPRKMFVKRYFYMMSIKGIALEMKTSVSNVKVSLMRTREKLKTHLEKAGISL